MNKNLKCKICSKEFTFTQDEESFYKDRNLNYPPKRCPDCRAKRRKEFKVEESEITKLKARIEELEKCLKSPI